jgi:hypothetical protein
VMQVRSAVELASLPSAANAGQDRFPREAPAHLRAHLALPASTVQLQV